MARAAIDTFSKTVQWYMSLIWHSQKFCGGAIHARLLLACPVYPLYYWYYWYYCNNDPTVA